MNGNDTFVERRGIRLVDVMIGVLILVLGTALVLPWLNWNRLGHRGRSEGANRLKQIALALHNYNDAHGGKLPPLTDVGEHALNNAGLNSLFFNLLPYLEQDDVFRIFQNTTPSYTNTATTGSALPPGGAAARVVQLFLDPADKSAAPDLTSTMTGLRLPWEPPAPFLNTINGVYATTSFAANGLLFGSNDAGIPRSFIDGTSNTIMIAQRPQVCDRLDGSPPVYNLWGFGYYGPTTPSFALLTPDQPAGMPPTGQAAPVLPLPAEWTQEKIAVRIGRTSAAPVVPDFVTPLQRVVNGKPCDPRIPGTPHGSGLLVALGDGSVRTVAPEISAWTFWAACTPNGNEGLHTDW